MPCGDESNIGYDKETGLYIATLKVSFTARLKLPLMSQRR